MTCDGSHATINKTWLDEHYQATDDSADFCFIQHIARVFKRTHHGEKLPLADLYDFLKAHNFHISGEFSRPLKQWIVYGLRCKTYFCVDVAIKWEDAESKAERTFWEVFVWNVRKGPPRVDHVFKYLCMKGLAEKDERADLAFTSRAGRLYDEISYGLADRIIYVCDKKYLKTMQDGVSR